MDLTAPGSGLIFWQIGSSVVMLAYFGLVIYALVDVIRGDFKDSQMKLIWVVLILFFPFFGALIYLFLGKKTEITPESSVQSSNKTGLNS